MEALQRGQPLGDAIEYMMSLPKTYESAMADVLQDWFQDWTARQFFLGIALGEVPTDQ